jgi:rRNA maturation endonuclease Nob1
MSITELKEQLKLEINDASEETLLEVQELLHKENDWENLPQTAIDNIKNGLLQSQNGQTRDVNLFLAEKKRK